MAASEPIFGIDLGTTNSCIAYVNKLGVVEVLPGDLGRVTPSVVIPELPGFALLGLILGILFKVTAAQFSPPNF